MNNSITIEPVSIDISLIGLFAALFLFGVVAMIVCFVLLLKNEGDSVKQINLLRAGLLVSSIVTMFFLIGTVTEIVNRDSMTRQEVRERQTTELEDPSFGYDVLTGNFLQDELGYQVGSDGDGEVFLAIDSKGNYVVIKLKKTEPNTFIINVVPLE